MKSKESKTNNKLKEKNENINHHTDHSNKTTAHHSNTKEATPTQHTNTPVVDSFIKLILERKTNQKSIKHEANHKVKKVKGEIKENGEDKQWFRGVNIN